MQQIHDIEALMKPGEVAALFDVDPKTVSSWADAGKLTVVRTLGGHRRYVQSEVMALRRAQAPARVLPAQRDAG
jgi:predicted site-specific integrase-resolvase